MAEFPHELHKVRGAILRYMGEQAPETRAKRGGNGGVRRRRSGWASSRARRRC